MFDVCSHGGGCGTDCSSTGNDDEPSEPPNISQPVPAVIPLSLTLPQKSSEQPEPAPEPRIEFDFDRLLQKTLGEFGKYQQFIVCFLCIPACFLSAYGTLDMVFMAYTPDHTCNATTSFEKQQFYDNSRKIGLGAGRALPNNNNNELAWMNNNNDSSDSFPSIGSPQALPDDTCHYTVTHQQYGSLQAKNETSRRDCLSWTYDTTYFDETMVTQWNLVCGQAITARTILSLLNVATLFAAFYSYAQDRWGRKLAFLMNLTFFLSGSCTSLLAPTPILFGLLKFVGGITCMWEICYCWALEFVGPSQRTTLTTMLSVIYSIATMSLALLAYLCRTWIELGWCTSAPFVLLYSYAIFIPESPRWLLSQGRVDEFLRVVESMARWNNVKIDLVALKETIVGKKCDSSSALLVENNNDMVVVLDDERSPYTTDSGNGSSVGSMETLSIAGFFASANLRWKTFMLTAISVIANQLYFAVPYSIENISANFYVSYVLQAAVEAPATLLNLFFLNRFGRVGPLSVSLLLSGVCCLLNILGDDVIGAWGSVLLITLSRFFVCTAVAITEQLGGELFPTVARGMGQGVSYIVSSLASISTQYVIFASHLWRGLPFLIMGSLVLLSGLLALFLPDTKDTSMPDTVQQAEAQGSVGLAAFKQNVRCCCKRSSTESIMNNNNKSFYRCQTSICLLDVK